MQKRDWLPHREQDFVDFCQKWLTSIENTGNQDAFKWEAAECAALAEKIRAFMAARAAFEAEDSSVKRLAKEEAREDAVDAMRDFANASVRFNRNMDEAAKLLMGLRPRDSTPSLHARPAGQPETVVENTLNRFEHKLKIISRETGGTTKPADAYGVHYVWQVGGEKPASGAELPKSKFSRKTSLVITYSEADKGKPAYYAACYENSKGEAGPWSPVAEAFIG